MQKQIAADTNIHARAHTHTNGTAWCGMAGFVSQGLFDRWWRCLARTPHFREAFCSWGVGPRKARNPPPILDLSETCSGHASIGAHVQVVIGTGLLLAT